MINKELIIKNLSKQRKRDYTYAISFLLIFSFFIIFAIKPSINTAVALRKNLDELKKTDALYDREIEKIIKLQKTLEVIREDLSLLSDAIPESSKTNDLIIDIKETIVKNNLKLDNMNIAEVYLKEKNSEKKTKKLIINLEANGNFKNLLLFIGNIENQRRLKVINTIILNKDSISASNSANIKANFNLEGYYL